MLYFEHITYFFHSFGMFLTYWIVYLPDIQHFDSSRNNDLLNAYLLISENYITYRVFLLLLTASLKCYPRACFFPATVRTIYTNNENENLRHLLVKRGKTGRGRITPWGRITPLSDIIPKTWWNNGILHIHLFYLFLYSYFMNNYRPFMKI